MGGLKTKNLIYLFLILLATVGAALLIYNPKAHAFNIKLGLDLRSGTHIALQLLPREDPVTGKRTEIDDSIMKVSMEIFEKRLNPEGTQEILIQREGKDRIIIEIPEETDVKKAEDLIKQTGVLEFKEQYIDFTTKKQMWRTVLTGSYLKRNGATVNFENISGKPYVAFEFNNEGAKKFAEVTQRNKGQPLGIFFDGKLTDAPIVEEAITGGTGRISGGGMDTESCERLKVLLNAGALPVDVKILESMTVDPMLGKESLNASLIAGFIGLSFVIIFMIAYYRVPGVLADVALVVYTLMLLATMVIWKFVLTLPGIAGIILSIGMAVDANVLIFERLKEELWADKSISNAVDTGFKRAFTSILDGHVTTFIGAMILYFFGASSIKGFGLTLMLGTLWSLFTAVFFTRVFVDFTFLNDLVKNKKLYGA
ncbi:MAG: protein translocase subunit SecD [Candidatus Eremiobacteraeota bacterium]|nr:protein translocase subunit SecD [Candidatus Eremiobacteraeota bacterium]